MDTTYETENAESMKTVHSSCQCGSKAKATWRWPPGWPSHTWPRAVEDDLKPPNFSLATAWRKTAHPDAWRAVIDTATLKT